VRLLRILRGLLLVAALQAVIAGAWAQQQDQAPAVIHMLDYVSVDYPGVVKDGQVLDAAEYDEQLEFARKSAAGLQQLPQVAGKADALAKAQALVARIEAKAPGAEVATLARGLAADVIRVWSVAVAPRQAPDMRRARSLYQAQCVACHGAEGRGDGPAASGLDPRPSNFHDDARMRQRSVYGLFNTITQGVGGTAMRGFTELSESDRWALAFLAAGMRNEAATVARGEALWQKGSGHAELRDLKSLVTTTADATQQQGGADLVAVHAFLLAHPDKLDASRSAALQLARDRVDQAVAAYARGDRAAARQEAIVAYLEGFELVETALDNVDAPLRQETEREMMALRGAIDQGASAQQVSAGATRVRALLDRAEDKLGVEGLSAGAAFASAVVILLREGLEAILVLAAIVAFVRKSGRADAMPYIHAGWIAALVLGLATWLVSSYLFAITGASRELTEGISALLAAAMLLYVGAWLHKRSHAQAWQSFVREQVTAALGQRTLWAAAGISFLAVYREMFEVVLFYQTLWAQAGAQAQHAVIGGFGAAAAVLALLAWAILRLGLRMPLAIFFGVTTILLVVMAVVFVGDGIAALQEAGVLGLTPAGAVSLPWLGVHPTVQGLAAQGAVLLLILAVWASTRRSRAAA
jgi:high-affinity iron transporter